MVAHWHLFADVQVGQPLLTCDKANAFLARVVATAGMTIIGGPYSVLGVVPGNEGVSSVVLLDLSSASVHEWPDHKPYALLHLDLYTCGARPSEDAFTSLFKELDPRELHIRVLPRSEVMG